MMQQRSIDEVKAALTGATRTIDLILGFGVGNPTPGEAPFTGVQYAANQVRFYDE